MTDREDGPATAAGSHPDAVTAAVERLARWKVWLPIAGLFVISAGLLFASSAPFSIAEVEAACGQAPPDVRFHSSGDEVNRFLQDCGSAGRRAYRNLQIADLFYPAIFGLFLASSSALALRRAAPGRPRLMIVAAIPLVGAAFDYLENAFAWAALTSYPEPAATDSLLGLASAAKTTTFWVAGLVLIVAITAALWSTARSAVAPKTGGRQRPSPDLGARRHQGQPV